jgi:hypothetical protein
MKNGVVYIAFIKIHKKKVDRIRELKTSVNSLKSHHPNISVTLFTDVDPKIKGIDNVKIITVDSIRLKQKYLYDSPYQNTLYLDCDTRIVGPIAEIFRLMERFDLAATHDLIRKDPKKSAIYKPYADIPDGFSEFGGGVFLFRKSPEVENFFKVWRRHCDLWAEKTGIVKDQPAMRVAIWKCPDLKFYVLPPEFNLRSKNYDNIKHRIHHEHNIWRKKSHGFRRIG